MGAPIHQSAQTEGRKPLAGSGVNASHSFSASAVSPKDGYRHGLASMTPSPTRYCRSSSVTSSDFCRRIKDLDVVDLGCGTGRWLARLAERSPRSLVGMDFSAEMLTAGKAQSSDDAANLVLADCSNLPLPRASADLILVSFVASYLEDLDAFAATIPKTSAAGGSIIPHRSSPRHLRCPGLAPRFPRQRIFRLDRNPCGPDRQRCCVPSN